MTTRKIERKTPPPVRLRELLAASKERGVAFDDAWRRAWAQMTAEKAWPHNTEQRAEWKSILEGTREEWRRNYEGEDAPFAAIADAILTRTETEEVATDEEVVGALVLA